MSKFIVIYQKDKDKIQLLNSYLDDINDLEIEYQNLKDYYKTGRYLKSQLKALERRASRIRKGIMKIATDLAKDMNISTPAVAVIMPNLPIQHDLEALESRSNY